MTRIDVFGIRSDLASRAAALSFTSNLALMVMKFAVAAVTGSIAVLSDAIDSAEDVAASTFAFLSIRLASQPADQAHPYGHGKAESLAAAGQALLIAGGATYIIARAVLRLTEEDVIIETAPGVIAMSVTALVNVGVVLYVARAARITGSVALSADTRHLWTNVAQALAVVVALILVAVTDNNIFDPVMALALAVYLLYTAGRVFMDALGEIMDTRLPTSEEAIIEQCLRQNDAVRSFHGLRTRRSGRQRYIDVHLAVDPNQTVEAAHLVCEQLERSIRDRLAGCVLTIHLEPDEKRATTPAHLDVEIGPGAG
jgi:cation diffusion facilitator family transporter